MLGRFAPIKIRSIWEIRSEKKNEEHARWKRTANFCSDRSDRWKRKQLQWLYTAKATESLSAAHCLWTWRVTVDTPSTNLVLNSTFALLNIPSFSDTTTNYKHQLTTQAEESTADHTDTLPCLMQCTTLPFFPVLSLATSSSPKWPIMWGEGRLNSTQGDHSPDTEIPWRFAALLTIVTGTHTMPVLLVLKSMIKLPSSYLLTITS